MHFADDRSNVAEKLKIFLGEGKKTLWEKEKMLVETTDSCERGL